MKNRAGIFALMITGVLLALLLAEILVRIFIPRYKMTTWIEMHPRGFMMNQAEVEAYHQFKDRRVTYRLNEYRLRGDEISDDGKKVLLLGDSYTFGLLLHEEDTFAAHLQNKADNSLENLNIHFLNAGVGGAGLADWPAWLEHKGDEISPDLVILFFNNWDVDRAVSKNLFVVNPEDSTLVESMRWKPREFMFRLGRMGWYRWIQRYSDLANILVTQAWRHLYFTDITYNFDQEKSETPIPEITNLYAESDYSMLLAEKLLKRMNDWCESNNCKFITAATGFFNDDDIGEHTEKFYHKISESPPDELLFFDNSDCLLDKVNGDFESIYIPDDGHPNEDGAAFIAECTWQWLHPLLKSENEQS
jgi:hypothetical protein